MVLYYHYHTGCNSKKELFSLIPFRKGFRENRRNVDIPWDLDPTYFPLKAQLVKSLEIKTVLPAEIKQDFV